MQESQETKKLTRRILRLFFIVLALVLLLTGYDHYAPLVFGNNKPLTDGGSAGILFWRDRRIARLQPDIELGDDSAWTQNDVQSAADYLKHFFAAQKIEYGLCAVRFREADSDRLLQAISAPQGTRYLALRCDYNVYDDTESGDKQGYYPNAVFVLQQSADGKWSLPAGGDPALQAVVCPLEQHRF